MALLGVWSLRTPASTTSTSTETTTASAASGPSATTTTTTRTSTGAAKTMTKSSDSTTIAAAAPSTTLTRTIPSTSTRTIPSTPTFDVVPVRFGVDCGEDLASPDELPDAPRPLRRLVARVTRDALSQVDVSRVDALADRDLRTRGPVDLPAPPAALGDPGDPDPATLPLVLAWMTRKLGLN